jgi:hypothetical protein
MSAGDILNPSRVRTQANERLDTVDADALSSSPRGFLDAFSRAIAAAPRNVGSSTPVGLIFQGFGLTLNPTSGSDNKVRVQSPVGVAFDSNGRMLIKENGITVDLTLAAGSSQIYAYFIEDNASTVVRRFISVTSPYAEAPNAIPTQLKGDVGYWVRSGDQTSIVSTDVVNGQTTPLCFLGVAINTAGVITMTGYDVVNAPNGQYAVNRLTSVLAPTTAPQGNAANGSIAHLHGLIVAALYQIGQHAWAGSAFLTPTAANNFGAYQSPQSSVQFLFEKISAGIFDNALEATMHSIFQFANYQGHPRVVFDHLGFETGNYSEIEENWRAAALSSDWSFSAGGGSGGGAVPADPTAAFTQRSLAVTSGTTTITPPGLSSQFLNYVDNNACVVLEGTVLTPAALPVLTDDNAFGFVFANGAGNNTRFVFYFRSSHPNWRCQFYLANTLTTDTDSGIVVATSTLYRFRIELVGSNNSSAAANTMTARFFINGALITTITAASWTPDKVKIYFGEILLNTSSFIWTLGRVRCQYMHILSSDTV